MNILLKMPVTDEEIKAECEALGEQIRIRNSEIEMLAKGIKHYQSLCKHVGQKTGCNERDGSWGNPCPTCGYSY